VAKVSETLDDPDLEWLILDSTVIRAPAHAPGAKKKAEYRQFFASLSAPAQALAKGRRTL
jgi:hypothetical protein